MKKYLFIVLLVGVWSCNIDSSEDSKDEIIELKSLSYPLEDRIVSLVLDEYSAPQGHEAIIGCYESLKLYIDDDYCECKDAILGGTRFEMYTEDLTDKDYTYIEL